MAKLIYDLIGVRGREMKLYDTRCEITTQKTVGSFLSGNFTDGKKTIFLCDVVGVQFKESNNLIGYLQFETPSMQMNNKSDNMFSENTFTFEDGKNGVTNRLMCQVYEYVVDRIETLKYANAPAPNVCDAEMGNLEDAPKATAEPAEPATVTAATFMPDNPDAPYWCGSCGHSGPYDGACPACGSTMKRFNTGDTALFTKTDKGTILCSACKTEQRADRRICWKCGATFVKEL